MGQHYKDIAERALKRREAAIPNEYLLPQEALSNLPRNLTTVPKTSGHFTAEELEIIESNAEDILLKIKSKTWTSLEVARAFSKAAIVAQQVVCSEMPQLQRNRNMLTQRTDKLPNRNPDSRGPRSCPISG
jgi:amidase